MDLDQIRQHLKLVMEIEPCGLRGLEEIVGVSSATLSRFLRGAMPNLKTLRTLEGFMDGKPKETAKPKVCRRFRIDGKTFLVEITSL